MNTAILITRSDDCESVASALHVDNIMLDDLEVETSTDQDKIMTRIRAKNINTLLATLDDIIACQMVAEKSIKTEKWQEEKEKQLINGSRKLNTKF